MKFKMTPKIEAEYKRLIATISYTHAIEWLTDLSGARGVTRAQNARVGYARLFLKD